MNLSELKIEASYQRYKLSTNFWAWAGRTVPDRLAYWVLIAQGVKHTKSNELVPGILFTDILKRVGNSLAEKHR
jgi:hypothetical protein